MERFLQRGLYADAITWRYAREPPVLVASQEPLLTRMTQGEGQLCIVKNCPYVERKLVDSPDLLDQHSNHSPLLPFLMMGSFFLLYTVQNSTCGICVKKAA